MTLIETLKRLGVPTDVGPHGVIDTTVTVYDIDELKNLFDIGLDAEGAASHHSALFDGITSAEGADDETLRRASAFVHGAGDLTDAERETIAVAFPLPVSVYVAEGPETVDKRTDISKPDGTARRMHITDLTLAQGGYYVCSATPLVFTIDKLTRTGNSGTSDADFNILGRPGVKPNTPGQPPAQPQAGKGKNGECTSGGIAGPGGTVGQTPTEGIPGTPGDPAVKAKPSMEATIEVIDSLVAEKITIFTQSGVGADGGDGGQGGQGGQGGPGGDGVDCGCTGNGGGPGHNGAKGGKGGRAGDGGDGVHALGNVVVRVPTKADLAKISPTAIPAPPGRRGKPGQGGEGGDGGAGGAKGKHNDAGDAGGTGGTGDPGDVGEDGKQTGQPGQILPSVV